MRLLNKKLWLSLLMVLTTNVFSGDNTMLDERKPDGIDNKGPITEDDFTGLEIMLLQNKVALKDKMLMVRGIYRTFVNCGSQLSTWHLFPGEVLFTLENISNGKLYQSDDLSTMNVSYAGDTIDNYSNEPCDQFVREYFEMNLFKSVHGIPLEPAKYRLSAKFLGSDSSEIEVELE